MEVFDIRDINSDLKVSNLDGDVRMGSVQMIIMESGRHWLAGKENWSSGTNSEIQELVSVLRIP